MFFVVPDDLTNLDNGQRYNTSIPQNVTFSEQGLPFGLGKTNRSNYDRVGVETYYRNELRHAI